MPKLAAKEYCTGCTACASICPKGCITLEKDGNGFICPVIDKHRCAECRLCEKRCPCIHPLKHADHMPKAYAVYSKDETIRLSSSSGGIFTELAKVVLQQGGAVFGAAYNEQFDVVHIGVETEDELPKLRGAKYAQSDLSGVFTQIRQKLAMGQTVLFSGTPCQVGGLKAFLHEDYSNLLTVDFVCHSVPSPVAWREYVKYRAEKDNNGELPTMINLRSKKTGWSRYQYSNLFKYKDGVIHTAKSNESLYMKLFVNGYISRESCDNCQFKGYARVSDLTLGDFWGIWETDPEMDDDKGTSAVLCQTERGRELLQRISERLVMKAVSLEDVSRQNPALLRASPPNERRSEALELIRNGKISACEAWFIPQKPSFHKRMQQLAGRVLRKIYRCCFQSNGRK